MVDELVWIQSTQHPNIRGPGVVLGVDFAVNVTNAETGDKEAPQFLYDLDIEPPGGGKWNEACLRKYQHKTAGNFYEMLYTVNHPIGPEEVSS